MFYGIYKGSNDNEVFTDEVKLNFGPKMKISISFIRKCGITP